MLAYSVFFLVFLISRPTASGAGRFLQVVDNIQENFITLARRWFDFFSP